MHFEIYQEKQGGLMAAATGDYRWRLIADNGRIIADSGEGYRNKADCQHGINLVKETTATTSVVDSTKSGMLSGLLGL